MSIEQLPQWALLTLWVIPAAALAAPPASARATESFRREHGEIQVHLGHVRDWNEALLKQSPAEQKKTAQSVVTFFEKHIKPHAEWEEKVLYPLVDRLAGGGRHRFTATMRHEHRIVGRWIEELAKEASKSTPDYTAFARRADNLLGLVSAHFEEEEEVLLPLIDGSMTREEFEKVVGKTPDHG